MSGGQYRSPALPPRMPTFFEIQDGRDDAAWKRLTLEVEQFHRQLPDGMVMVVVTSLDPGFHVVTMRRGGPYVILDGVDSDGNPGRVLHHVAQLSIRMQTYPKEEQGERAVFGFVDHGGGA